jgi:hypothetical protein
MRHIPVMTFTLSRSILALALCALVAGCLTTSPEQQAQRNEERCVARGYQPKTDAFNDCVVRIEGDRTQRMETNRRYEMEKPGGPGTPRGY